MAAFDSLAGLWDRRTFDEDLGVSARDALVSDLPLALIFVVIDHFKKINYTHGRLFGDMVLKGIAECLLRVAKGKGRVYRCGGEEMAVILSNHGVLEAIGVTERTRISIEQERQGGIAVMASFGVCVLPDHGDRSAPHVKCADAAMHDAKNRDRNLV